VTWSCRWEGIPPWTKSTFPEPSNRSLVRNQAKASHTPPKTQWPAAVRDFWQARNVAPVVSTSSTKTTYWPQATMSLGTDSNIPSSASNRSPRVDSVKEDRCRIRRNVVEDMSRFHTLASPAHNASDGLNPRRQTRRQWDGTGIKVVFSGGGRHRLPIHMPSVLACLGNPPYFMRCTTDSVGGRSLNPNPKTGSPARSFARTQPARSSAREGHCQQQGGHTPATSLGSNVSPHDQQRPLLPTMVQVNEAGPIALLCGSSLNALSSQPSVVNSSCEIWQG